MRDHLKITRSSSQLVSQVETSNSEGTDHVDNDFTSAESHSFMQSEQYLLHLCVKLLVHDREAESTISNICIK